MEKEFVPYEPSLRLKALGFDEICIYHFKKNNKGKHSSIPTFEMNTPFGKNHNILESRVSSPTFSQAFRWFREKYNLFGCIDLHSCIPPHWFVRIDNIVTNDYVFHSEDEDKKFTIYEEAELACITKLIEIVEQQNQK